MAELIGAKKDDKIIDLMSTRPTAFTSLEFYPPRTSEGVQNLRSRILRMKENTQPVFMDVTWGAGGSTSDTTMDLVKYIKECGCVANMHLTCTNMDPGLVKKALSDCRRYGICNIVALRGDAQEGEGEWKASEGGFSCALDLVKFIRAEYGDEFGISIAGYPEGHPNAITVLKDGEEDNLSEKEKLRVSSSEKDGVVTKCVCRDEDYKKEMEYLKLKYDAGADFIITQMFFDTDVFKNFCDDCKEYGIDCPIVPGIMCINNFGGFFRMTGFCKTRVPEDLKQEMIKRKDSEAEIKKFGAEFGTAMCMRLVSQGAPCVHFYTLNLEKVVYGILDGLGWTKELSSKLEALDSDANTMQAKGSAWARVGDEVTSMFGKGIVEELRPDGAAKIKISNWKLANDQDVFAFLKQGTFKKI
ncbi:hypothetical protein TrLO_g8557 [Triparma laevis f. longispina]|uniref:Methylenetetrahydrofolate reductase (NAD(P)H) n=1 Tax=Triparma laevis f. longispina TaxID=1714387 RepID=A0A9W7KWA3_9STRA|nr:hypothetical protein TrLO_g8557 [Triparma laevis f. longispina]